jgi:hypothetical protein
MVSYTTSTVLLRPHSKHFSGCDFMEVFIQLVFGACKPFPGSILGRPTIAVPTKTGAPGTAHLRNSVVLIGSLRSLEVPINIHTGAR